MLVNFCEKVVGGKWICGLFWYGVHNLLIVWLQLGQLLNLSIPMSSDSVIGGIRNLSSTTDPEIIYIKELLRKAFIIPLLSS